MQMAMAAKVAGQLLANLATARSGAAALWQDLFPARLLAMLSASSAPGPHHVVPEPDEVETKWRSLIFNQQLAFSGAYGCHRSAATSPGNANNPNRL